MAIRAERGSPLTWYCDVMRGSPRHVGPGDPQFGEFPAAKLSASDPGHFDPLDAP